MRPILLQIKGLQSYRELQEVDFTELTGAGVFGIFGPTGSGKSTLLDAITLALYGKVERAPGGTQSIMNQAEDTLAVSFSFELASPGGGTVRYRVDRQFKRNGEQSMLGSLCRLIRDQHGETIVLADKAGEVNSQVQELLGLSMADFTRAVVLPQGKFAEFLTLAGKERRAMLQRLFHLETYGDRLSAKTASRFKAADVLVKQLQAEQQGLGDASAEALAEAERRLAEAMAAAATARERLAGCEQLAAEQRAVRELQREAAALAARADAHALAAPRIAELAARLARAADAERLRPLAVRRAAAAAQHAAAQREAAAAQAALGAAQAALAAAQAAHAAARDALAAQEAPLAARLEQLRHAAELAAELQAARGQLRALEAAAAASAERLAALAAAEARERELRERALQRQAQLKAELAAAETPAAHRSRLQEALQASRELERTAALREEHRAAAALLRKDEAQQQARLEALQRFEASWLQRASQWAAGVHLLRAEAELFEHQLDRLEQAAAREEERGRLLQLEAERQSMAVSLAAQLRTGECCPVCGSTEHPALTGSEAAQHSAAAHVSAAGLDQGTLNSSSVPSPADSAQQAESMRIEAFNSMHAEAFNSTESEAFNSKQSEASNSAQSEGSNSIQSEATNSERSTASDHESLLKELDVCRRQSRDGQLAAARLKDALTGLARRLELDELELSAEQPPLTEAFASEREAAVAAAWEERLYTIKQHFTIFNDTAHIQDSTSSANSLTDSSAASVASSAWQSYKQSLQACLERLDQLRKETARLEQEQQQLLQEQRDLEKQRKEGESRRQTIAAQLETEEKREAERERSYQEQLAAWLQQYSPWQLEQMQAMVQQLREQDAAVDELRVRLDKSVAFLQEKQEQLDKLRTELSEADKESARSGTEVEALQRHIAQQQLRLTAMVGEGDAARLAEETNSQLLQLRGEATRTAKAHDEAVMTYQAASSAAAAAAQAEQSAAVLEADTHRDWQEQAELLGFADTPALEAALLSDEEQHRMTREVEEHSKLAHQLTARRRELEQQLGDRHVTDEQWEHTEKEASASRVEYEHALQHAAKTERDCDDLKTKHARWMELEEERLSQQQQLTLLGKLQSVLRGNAFVEYLAEEQLAHVSRAASERLGQLTRRKYAIEVDSGGGFVIRDDANGGVKRPVTTLSGGETFLTSLSLALALSGQIQLKGEYPLEFFFLDEGFGTLDQELLDTVVTALEKLHLNNLTVGVISHVPELRARLQRKLIVHPAEPGGRGSRVSLELL
ncbi:AAA family ATPase [Paenibacillus sp. YYML68]|uniref:AAA family ATPase n=1 Tax=Paenibacillus sp. YYML68 TaxID=2909250 RepID=UPI00248F73AA|nr:AAA family ATPase [Paenibacillus sp. YYML68]